MLYQGRKEKLSLTCLVLEIRLLHKIDTFTAG